MRWPVMLAALAVAGCSTPYQEGVAAEQMTADTFRIVARGNAYTADTALQDYTVLKAAKTTKNMGGTHFTSSAPPRRQRAMWRNPRRCRRQWSTIWPLRPTIPAPFAAWSNPDRIRTFACSRCLRGTLRRREAYRPMRLFSSSAAAFRRG
jgi:hypothetical protein